MLGNSIRDSTDVLEHVRLVYTVQVEAEIANSECLLWVAETAKS